MPNTVAHTSRTTLRMLKSEDIEIQIARGVGGDSILVLHKPTGIRRGKGPPLPNSNTVARELLREIEAELVEKGLTHYILPDRPQRLRLKGTSPRWKSPQK